MSKVRLGQLLIEGEVLTVRQVDAIIAEQERTGEPFGLLAERLYGVDPHKIEEAWARQYAGLTRTVRPDMEVFDDQATSLVTRRQAWQFRILPLRFEGRELLIATTQQHLRRALRFATNVIGIPVFFVMADPLSLGRALCTHYPLPGMEPEAVLADPPGVKARAA
jgi:MshEN domain